MRRASKRQANTDQLFSCVPRLLADSKYFAISLQSIEKLFYGGGRVDLRAAHTLSADEQTPEDLTLPLRLRVSGVPQHSESWEVALLLYNRRIDGLGHEEAFCDIYGSEQNGWHRHIWNPKTQEASGKISATLCNDDRMTFRDFLIRSFKFMKISYATDEYDHLF